MSDGEQNRRRRRVLIDPDFQLAFVNRIAGWLFSYLILCLVFCVALPFMIALVRSGSVLPVPGSALDARVLLRLVALPVLVTFLCIFVHGIRETFHIAGPKYRFEQVFRNLRHLRLPPVVRVRKGDYLQDTAARLDECVQSLRSVVGELQQRSHDLQGALGSVGPEWSKRPDLVRVRHAAESLHEAVLRFELLGAAEPAVAAPTVVQPLEEAASVPAFEPRSSR